MFLAASTVHESHPATREIKKFYHVKRGWLRQQSYNWTKLKGGLKARMASVLRGDREILLVLGFVRRTPFIWQGNSHNAQHRGRAIPTSSMERTLSVTLRNMSNSSLLRPSTSKSNTGCVIPSQLLFTQPLLRDSRNHVVRVGPPSRLPLSQEPDHIFVGLSVPCSTLTCSGSVS